jgi:hypothetical protein
MAAIATVLSREIHATTSRRPVMDINVILSANKMDRSGKIVKQHLILGTDKRDAEEQRDLWLFRKSIYQSREDSPSEARAADLADADRQQACPARFDHGGVRRARRRGGGQGRGGMKAVHGRLLHRKKAIRRNMPIAAVIKTPVRMSSRARPT